MTLYEALQDIGKGRIVDNGCDYQLVALAKGSYILISDWYSIRETVTLYGSPADNARKLEEAYHEHCKKHFIESIRIEYTPINKTTYATQDGDTITKIGRAKRIQYTTTGEPYFVWNGRRTRLDEVMKLTAPVFYEDENGKTGFLSGYITMTNCWNILVEIDDNGESVQLYNVERR